MFNTRTRGSVLAATAAAVAAVMAAAEPASTTAEAAATANPNADTLPFSIGTPQLAQITSGRTGPTQAPWNEFQGDPAFAPYASNGTGTLYPSYTPGGVATTTGGVTEPNLAVFPGAASGTDGKSPYPTGTVGTPGTLDGYCGTGTQAAATAPGRYPVRQPADTTLPLSPAYFPHVVRNLDGTLTGYFDWRPKDADEALVAADSSDNGRTWTYQGEALEENPGYCPSADTTDDGQGHANILTIGGKTFLYTLPRAAGDSVGVGMIVHRFDPTTHQPLGDLPAVESVGIDPDAFVPAGIKPISMTAGGAGQPIPLTTLGTANSPEQLVVGSFVDLTQSPVPASVPPTVITCGGLDSGTNSLTGCTIPTGSTLTVQAGDLIEQVLGFAGAPENIPNGPNTTTGDGGLSSLPVASTAAVTAAAGFTNPLTGTLFNNTVPLRLYVNGTAIYCTQGNANPTTKIEDCTAGSGNPSYSVATSEPITGDPIVPATAYDAPHGSGMTNGLIAPDGIVGELPRYPVTDRGKVPFGATFVMYTEKELNYYTAANTPGTGTATNSAAGFPIDAIPGQYIGQDLAQFPTLPSTNGDRLVGPVTISMGLSPSSKSTTSAIVSVTCQQVDETTGTFTGCAVPSANNTWVWGKNSWLAAPGAALVDPATLAAIGEGSASDYEKLYKNNEDLSVLRVAWTTDGVNFSSDGLANDGVISGQNTCGKTGASPICAGSTVSSPYDDINNPTATGSPTNSGGVVDLNEYADNDAANGTGPSTGGTDTGGVPDATEMRWVGSAGSIIDQGGIYQLFLSGAWAADGDSDAFNHVFYATSTDGEHWSVPTPVISTDYSFAASATQDKQLSANQNDPLGISGYYSGRAYAPTVVPNRDGTLTMVFGADRIPKSLAVAGTMLGTGSTQYTIGATDPALYRNILVVTLTPSRSPFGGRGDGPIFDTHHQQLLGRSRP